MRAAISGVLGDSERSEDSDVDFDADDADIERPSADAYLQAGSGWLQTLAAFQPATYLVTGLERVMVAHVSVLDIAPELLSLALSAGIAFVISQQLFRWEPGARVPRSAKLWAASAVIPFLLLGAWESTHGQLRAGARQDYRSFEQPAPTDPAR